MDTSTSQATLERDNPVKPVIQTFSVVWDNIKTLDDLKVLFKGINMAVSFNIANKVFAELAMDLVTKGFILPHPQFIIDKPIEREREANS